jgi:ketosteroid isomerase-like protein
MEITHRKRYPLEMTIKDTSGTSDLKLEQEFFEALLHKDVGVLEEILADDFSLADLTGSLIDKNTLKTLVAQGVMDFVAITPRESQERFYGATGIVTGRTTLRVRFKGAEITFESRYTHVFATQGGRRRLVAAQGTPIKAPEDLL